MPPITLLPLELPTKPADRRYWGQLQGSSLSLALAEMAAQHPGLLLVVCPDGLIANQLIEELHFFLGGKDHAPILTFPDWETLPYDNFSPHNDIVSERLTALHQLSTLKQGVLVVPITTLMHRLAPPEFLAHHLLLLRKGEKITVETFRQRLVNSGYRCVSEVMAHGEFAVRGALIDLFPMGSDLPYRIDLFDDEIETLRTFDPETQRSLETVEAINLLPAHEFPLTDAAVTQFRQAWRAAFEGDPTQCPIYQDVSQKLAPAGIEYYLPLFFPKTGTLFEYLPQHTLIANVRDLDTAAMQFWQEVKHRYEQYRHDRLRPILPPTALFLQPQEVYQAFKAFPEVFLSNQEVKPGAGRINLNTMAPPDLHIQQSTVHPLLAVESLLISTQARVLFCAETKGRRESLLQLLKGIHITPTAYATWQDFLHDTTPIGITVAPLEAGVWLTQPPIQLIAESQLFGEQVMQSRRRKLREVDNDAAIRNLAELQIGDPVVHIDHGVGRYLGLETLTVLDEQAEFLALAYAEGDKLYVPVASLHLVSRYSGAALETAPLHRLGNDIWQKAKRKAAERVADVAAELLEVYAKRAAKSGFAFPKMETEYAVFAAAFPFEETPDQKQAIEAVIQDMQSAQPMDRLVCGDVGFGKTEVAIRAAFIAIQAGKQVVMLVPTTLLAQQHYETFKDRFADWPIVVEVLSRFRTKKEQHGVLDKLQAGKVDIVIGTHTLLQENINLKDLGLLIIDEEHRFGVKQKEKLKALRTEIDILTLTATPIPRTLNMALSHIRDLSIIATPPAKRLSIKTFVRETNQALIREAIMREIMRGGQVYYLHNNVETIERTASELTELVPEARIGIANGQMRERELEQVMSNFYHHRFNVLVCTTIIETGIDIPTANTIIIERADKFGLAQLHQLRGRVGRSHHQAYAYLFTPPPKLITKDASKRLEAIESLEDLGAGFALATHDLEIRGAGELLGDEQSGNIEAVGFSLYMELLERAIASLKAGKALNLDEPISHLPEVNLQVPALIPEDYLHDVHTRLVLYKRIANAKTNNQLDELEVEMVDRFGLLPLQVKYLFGIARLKLLAKNIGVRKIEGNNKGVRIEFAAEPRINLREMIRLIQENPARYKMEGADKLKCMVAIEDRMERIEEVAVLLNKIT